MMPTTQNEAWGFWGTMGGHASVAWPVAIQQIAEITGEPPESVRAFLDSKQGRHFADSVQDGLAGGLATNADIDAAVAQAIAKWMDWRIGRITARETGIPRGLPYLTGFVIHCGLDEVCY